MITLDKVSFFYDGTCALREVSLTVARGESLVLMGPNGCGKSTLLRLLNGLIFPQSGAYRFDGAEITARAMRTSRFAKRFHQRMGFVFQNPDTQLFCGSVEEELAFGPRQMGLDGEQVRARVEELLELLGLETLRERPPYHLSGGEKRKVALACTLALNPEVLVLDEPLIGLDEETQDQLLEILSELKAAGKTLILSTHERWLAREIGVRFAVMDREHRLTGVSDTLPERGARH